MPRVCAGIIHTRGVSWVVCGISLALGTASVSPHKSRFRGQLGGFTQGPHRSQGDYTRTPASVARTWGLLGGSREPWRVEEEVQSG